MGSVISRSADPTNPVMLELVYDVPVATTDGSEQHVVNIWHLAGNPSNPGGVDVAAVGNSFAGIAAAQLVNLIHPDYIGGEVSVRMLDDPTALKIVLGASFTGTAAGDRLPTLAAVVVQLHTNARGRCFRGSKHFAPISEDDTDGDELTAGKHTDWTNQMVALLTNLPAIDGNGNEFDLCVLSRNNSVLVGPSPSFVYTLVDDLPVNLKIGTMRRRKEGVGQ